MSKPRIAVIGGSSEGFSLAERLKKCAVQFTLFLPLELGVQARTPAIPYNAEFDWNVALAGFDIVICAAHPFSLAEIQQRLPKMPVLFLVRPPWIPGYMDRWIEANDSVEAAQIVQERGFKHILLTIGRARAAPFMNFENTRVTIRKRNTLSQSDLSPKVGSVVYQPGPFTAAAEKAFFQAEHIDAIATHNAGGNGGMPKLLAAFELGLPVVMVQRPRFDAQPQVQNVSDALSWLNFRFGLDLPVAAS